MDEQLYHTFNVSFDVSSISRTTYFIKAHQISHLNCNLMYIDYKSKPTFSNKLNDTSNCTLNSRYLICIR